jgi:2-polyprenyl-6-methoxyphenol hydroxylase-like FAD-dependent oxidoreductase
VTASNKEVDLLIIGGGLAGSSLGRSMAMAGAHVLIIEKETRFRDRIRGEILVPWGSVEALVSTISSCRAALGKLRNSIFIWRASRRRHVTT